MREIIQQQEKSVEETRNKAKKKMLRLGYHEDVANEIVWDIIEPILTAERQKREEMVEAEREFALQYMTPEDSVSYLKDFTNLKQESDE